MNRPALVDGQDRLTTDAADIVVFTQKWEADHPGDGDDYSAQVYARIMINGVEVPWAAKVTAEGGNDFVRTTLEVLTRSIRFVPLDQEDWKREDLSDFDLGGAR